MVSRKRLMRGWDPVRGRAAVKAAVIAESPKRAPGRKDTRAWCKGKAGREHQPEIVFCAPVFRRATVTCEWAPRWFDGPVEWHCYHEEHCRSCGKVLRSSVGNSQCPVYPGSSAQREAAEAESAAAWERWKDWRATRRPVVTGPQHYRRRRDG